MMFQSSLVRLLPLAAALTVWSCSGILSSYQTEGGYSSAWVYLDKDSAESVMINVDMFGRTPGANAMIYRKTSEMGYFNDFDVSIRGTTTELLNFHVDGQCTARQVDFYDVDFRSILPEIIKLNDGADTCFASLSCIRRSNIKMSSLPEDLWLEYRFATSDTVVAGAIKFLKREDEAVMRWH